ncbi:MAG: hypothetical protein JWO81_861 [Alphaproteobacteria bacterium]|nr:hypothetical protein [Alphaproteobacteria bacterium]
MASQNQYHHCGYGEGNPDDGCPLVAVVRVFLRGRNRWYCYDERRCREGRNDL